MPAYFPGMMLPNPDMMRDYSDQAIRPRQHWRQSPRNNKDHHSRS
jgi:hypothetical protein